MKSVLIAAIVLGYNPTPVVTKLELFRPPPALNICVIPASNNTTPSYESGWIGNSKIDAYIDQITDNPGARRWAKDVYRCESGGNAHAVNGIYMGLFQFCWNTYQGNGGTNIWDWQEQTRIAIKMYLHSQAWQWQCK